MFCIQGNLLQWLMDQRCYDLFSVIFEGGDRTAIYQNTVSEPTLLHSRQVGRHQCYQAVHMTVKRWNDCCLYVVSCLTNRTMYYGVLCVKWDVKLCSPLSVFIQQFPAHDLSIFVYIGIYPSENIFFIHSFFLAFSVFSLPSRFYLQFLFHSNQ